MHFVGQIASDFIPGSNKRVLNGSHGGVPLTHSVPLSRAIRDVEESWRLLWSGKEWAGPPNPPHNTPGWPESTVNKRASKASESLVTAFDVSVDKACAEEYSELQRTVLTAKDLSRHTTLLYNLFRSPSRFTAESVIQRLMQTMESVSTRRGGGSFLNSLDGHSTVDAARVIASCHRLIDDIESAVEERVNAEEDTYYRPSLGMQSSRSSNWWDPKPRQCTFGKQ